MTDLKKPNLEGVILEAAEHESDGWKYWRVINSASLTPAAIRLLQMPETHGCDLVLLYDEGGDSEGNTTDEILEHCAQGCELGLYPKQDTPEPEMKCYAVTRTTWDTFKIMAENEDAAKDKIISMELGTTRAAKPDTTSAELNVEAREG